MANKTNEAKEDPSKLTLGTVCMVAEGWLLGLLREDRDQHSTRWGEMMLARTADASSSHGWPVIESGAPQEEKRGVGRDEAGSVVRMRGGRESSSSSSSSSRREWEAWRWRRRSNARAGVVPVAGGRAGLARWDDGWVVGARKRVQKEEP